MNHGRACPWQRQVPLVLDELRTFTEYAIGTGTDGGDSVAALTSDCSCIRFGVPNLNIHVDMVILVRLDVCGIGTPNGVNRNRIVVVEGGIEVRMRKVGSCRRVMAVEDIQR